jgi:hypothetical protein
MLTFHKLNLPAVLPEPGRRSYRRTLFARWDDLKAAQHVYDETAMRAQREADEYGIAIARLRTRMERDPAMTVEGFIAAVNARVSA